MTRTRTGHGIRGGLPTEPATHPWGESRAQSSLIAGTARDRSSVSGIPARGFEAPAVGDRVAAGRNSRWNF
jgi:hypothetical protein